MKILAYDEEDESEHRPGTLVVPVFLCGHRDSDRTVAASAGAGTPRAERSGTPRPRSSSAASDLDLGGLARTRSSDDTGDGIDAPRQPFAPTESIPNF